MPTYRLDLSYDGTGFHGFARQPEVRTVQGVLEETLATVVGEPVDTSCAGRTDAGVHARRQVVSFRSETELDPERLRSSVTAMLAPEVAALGAALVPDDFDARFSAQWRMYRYQVLNRRAPDPLRRHTSWHVDAPLDLAAMDHAMSYVVGEHDFASFCRRAEGRSTVREVLDTSWSREAEDTCVYVIRATAFCHQMVRSLVGYSVEVGLGRISADSVPRVLGARDRSAAGRVAPPRGLILWDVGYD